MLSHDSWLSKSTPGPWGIPLGLRPECGANFLFIMPYKFFPPMPWTAPSSPFPSNCSCSPTLDLPRNLLLCQYFVLPPQRQVRPALKRWDHCMGTSQVWEGEELPLSAHLPRSLGKMSGCNGAGKPKWLCAYISYAYIQQPKTCSFLGTQSSIVTVWLDEYLLYPSS